MGGPFLQFGKWKGSQSKGKGDGSQNLGVGGKGVSATTGPVGEKRKGVPTGEATPPPALGESGEKLEVQPPLKQLKTLIDEKKAAVVEKGKATSSTQLLGDADVEKDHKKSAVDLLDPEDSGCESIAAADESDSGSLSGDNGPEKEAQLLDNLLKEMEESDEREGPDAAGGEKASSSSRKIGKRSIGVKSEGDSSSVFEVEHPHASWSAENKKKQVAQTELNTILASCKTFQELQRLLASNKEIAEVVRLAEEKAQRRAEGKRAPGGGRKSSQKVPKFQLKLQQAKKLVNFYTRKIAKQKKMDAEEKKSHEDDAKIEAAASVMITGQAPVVDRSKELNVDLATLYGRLVKGSTK